MNLESMIIDYVLRMLDECNVLELQHTMETAQKLVRKLPRYQCQAVLSIIFGGDADAE